MNAAKRECMVTGKRIAMVCQELLSSFESLEFSYRNGSSLSRISGQGAIYNILARIQIRTHYCEIWEIIPDLLSFFRLEFARGLWGSNQQLSQESQVALNFSKANPMRNWERFSSIWIRLMKRRAGLKKALDILGCLTPSFTLVIPQTPR